MGNQDVSNQEFNNYLTGSDYSLISDIPKWRSDFICLGGLDHLIQIFQEYKNLEYKQYSYFNKLILGFILEILKKFIMASFTTRVKGIHRYVQLATLINYDLSYISKYLSVAERSP